LHFTSYFLFERIRTKMKKPRTGCEHIMGTIRKARRKEKQLQNPLEDLFLGTIFKPNAN